MGRKCRFQSIDDQFFRRFVGCGDKIVIAFQLVADALLGKFIQQGAGFPRNGSCRFEELRHQETSYRYLMSCLYRKRLGSPSRVRRMKCSS